MPRTNDSRDRMVASAAVLLGRRGVAATGFRDVVAHAGTSRGGLAHHFPGGKQEMVGDAARFAGGLATAAIETSGQDGLRAAIATVCGIYRRALVDSDFAAGCPVGAVASEGHADAGLRAAAHEVFGDWRAALAPAIRAAGHRGRDVDEIAALLIAAVEGALLLCRVDGNTDALDAAERQLTRLVA